MERKDRIRALLDEMCLVVESSLNRAVGELWTERPSIALDRFRCTPALYWLEPSTRGKVLGIEPAKHYADPLACLKDWLLMHLFRFHRCGGDNCCDTFIPATPCDQPSQVVREKERRRRSSLPQSELQRRKEIRRCQCSRNAA